ncbi:MAG: division/cell wall cluster transcriptional repressor MraZ [Firmicutes bacterium]|nr:division/cell wall cluster transcriptional repressor MraZ [Bacillota bacterium]
MFKGKFSHTIDAKGRIIIPAKYREALGLKCVISKGKDGALNIYTNETWDEFDEKFKLIPQSDPIGMRYIRDFYANASDLEPDNNGRVMIPQDLKEFAGLKKDVVTIGAFDHIEIWDADRYRDYTENSTISDADMMAALAKYGL